MNRCRALVRLLALVGTLLLVSCIDGREEYWIQADGSGRADITYSLPAAAARFQGGAEGVDRMLAEFLATTPAITTSSHEVTETDGRLTVHVTGTFDSVIDLRKVSRGGPMNELPPSANGLTGDIKLDLAGRDVSFSRIISVREALPGSSFLPASRFEGHRLTYIVHLPLAAKNSNASRIEDGGHTLVWDYPLSEALRCPFTLRFKAPVPIPMRWLVGTIAGVMVLVLVVFAFIRNWRRKRGTDPDGM